MAPDGMGPDKSGESLFRLCAFGLSWFLAGFPASVVAALVIVFAGESGNAIAVLALAPLLTYLFLWLVWYFLPLKKHGQTVGMKWFGLVMVRADGSPPSWTRVLFREVVQLGVLSLTLGLAAVACAMFGPSDRTLFDSAFGTRVIRCKARLRSVDEFREFRACTERTA